MYGTRRVAIHSSTSARLTIAPRLLANSKAAARNPYAWLRKELTPAEVAALRAKTDEFALNPDSSSRHSSWAGTAFVLRQCEDIGSPFVNINSFAAYVARPTGTPKAAVIVIQEIFGVNEGIRRKCDHWASLGYLAVAPDLFWMLEPGLELDPDVEAEAPHIDARQTRYDLRGELALDTGPFSAARVLECRPSAPTSSGDTIRSPVSSVTAGCGPERSTAPRTR